MSHPFGITTKKDLVPREGIRHTLIMATETSYHESAAGIEISAARAAKECRDHGAYMSDLEDELGVHDTYMAQDVLNWLGY